MWPCTYGFPGGRFRYYWGLPMAAHSTSHTIIDSSPKKDTPSFFKALKLILRFQWIFFCKKANYSASFISYKEKVRRLLKKSHNIIFWCRYLIVYTRNHCHWNGRYLVLRNINMQWMKNRLFWNRAVSSWNCDSALREFVWVRCA